MLNMEELNAIDEINFNREHNENNKKYKYDIRKNISDLIRRTQNTKVTFFHRFIYQEDDASVIKAIAERAVDKLRAMGIVSHKFKIDIDEESLEYALEQYEEGNRKFYCSEHSSAKGEDELV